MADLNEDVSSFSRCPSYVEAKQLKGISHEFLSLTETEQDGEAISKMYLSWAEAATLHNQVCGEDEKWEVAALTGEALERSEGCRIGPSRFEA